MCKLLTLTVVASALAGGAALVAVAQPAVPAPSWARSLEVIDDGAVLHMEPAERAKRRGTVKVGTRLPVKRRLAAPGCPTGFWYETGSGAFVCEHAVRPSQLPPAGEPQPAMRDNRLLPFTYAFVGVDGTRAYAHPSDYDADQYVEAFGEGFGLVITGRESYAGITFLRTRRGLWVDRSSLRFARGSDFVGVELAAGDPTDLAWVLRDDVRIRQRPGGRVVRSASRRAIVHVRGEAGRGYLELTDGTFVRDRDVGRMTVSARPDSVAHDERWIDVDVDQQVMVAYHGDVPVYATLVSTGRERRATATPLGEFRIWVKLATSDMDDLERSDVEQNYAIESVPWVQYFEGSNGFHAAFWHDDFGRRRSHGCVNLSPRDARWLFDFTRPALPPGWYAILPNREAPGTLVRVRDGSVTMPAP